MPRLRDVREERGLSRRELSEMCGISASAIILLETGITYDPKISTVARLADALGVKFLDLVDPRDTLARQAQAVADSGARNA